MKHKNARLSMIRWLAGTLLATMITCLCHGSARAQQAAPTPDDHDAQIANGAYLYATNCTRCHGVYDKARLARGTEREKLADAIAGEERDRCRVQWGRSNGGPLRSGEIGDLIAYMQAWETAGQEPLDEPAPTATFTPTATPDAGADVATPTATTMPLPAAIAAAIAQSTVNEGAWLYSRHCTRCHFDYSRARMGSGRTADEVREVVTSGKTATTMRPFALTQGGPLRLREINAVVDYIAAWEAAGAGPALPAALDGALKQAEAELLASVPQAAAAAAGERTRGLALFAQHCAVCHGAAGQGGVAGEVAVPALARVWSVANVEETVRTTIALGRPGTPMIGWFAGQGGPLDAQGLNDLVALVLAWEAESRDAGTPVSPALPAALAPPAQSGASGSPLLLCMGPLALALIVGVLAAIVISRGRCTD